MNETMLNTGTCSATKEPSTGEQLLAMARRIGSEAEGLAEMAENKLSPFTTQPTPEISSDCEKQAPERIWPPYFDEMRAILNDISKSVLVTQRAIKRVEL